LQPRPSNARTDTATDESIDCALKSNYVLHRETGGSLEGPAELPVNIFAGETRHTFDSVEEIAIRGKYHLCPDGQEADQAISHFLPCLISLASLVPKGSIAQRQGFGPRLSEPLWTSFWIGWEGGEADR
jgi:hypothetical protein